MISSLKVCTSVWMGWRLGGGVWMTLKSRAPISKNCKVGMGASRRGQRIHIHLQLAEFLLDGDAELLLLINNQQTKVFELNVFSQDTVGTDKNIHFPFGKPFHATAFA